LKERRHHYGKEESRQEESEEERQEVILLHRRTRGSTVMFGVCVPVIFHLNSFGPGSNLGLETTGTLPGHGGRVLFLRRPCPTDLDDPNPKSEARNPNKPQNLNSNQCLFGFGHSDFIRISDFGLLLVFP
jgi:hypothetical protein